MFLVCAILFVPSYAVICEASLPRAADRLAWNYLRSEVPSCQTLDSLMKVPDLKYLEHVTRHPQKLVHVRCSLVERNVQHIKDSKLKQPTVTAERSAMQALKVIIGGGFLTAATYGALSYSGAYKVQKEYLKLQSKVEAEAATKRDLQKRIDEQDSAAELLVQECSTLEKRIQETRSEIEAIRDKLQSLESSRDTDAKAQQDKRTELKAIVGRRSSLQQEFLERQKSYQKAEAAAREAQQKAEEGWRKANPLNHPRVKELLAK